MVRLSLLYDITVSRLVSGWWLVVGGWGLVFELITNGSQLIHIYFWFLFSNLINQQPTTNNHQPSTINHQLSTINYQLSTNK
ncbi:MAG: hypothetical protein VKN72_13600 [Nostocales cyanobacterium 94392]|nr:hypothetical protein [Nostocales cyanobacterium 94392]